MSGFSIFVVEDDPVYGVMLERHLALNPDYAVERFMTGQDCLKNLYRNPSVITLDYSLPDSTGEVILRKIRQYDPGIQVVIVSGQEDVATAVNLLREGAYDYIVKDSNTRQRLWNVILKIRENVSLREQVEILREEVGKKFEFEKTILGQSPAVVKIYSLIEKAARSSITVSITGETGTGKELVAKAIHYASDRKKKPFVAVNMSAIPKTLLESELFGHEKGAFTDAIARKKGKFEEADGGTLFLDEVSEMELHLQPKLLRALQEREITRVGGTELVKFDVRVITATHKDIAAEVQNGTFRQDLYYRILGLPVHLPPLRERGADILLLAKHFADSFCRENRMKTKTFSESARDKLMAYAFPGNVRELKAMVDVAVVMADGDQLQAEDLSFPLPSEPGSFLRDELTLDQYCGRIVRAYIDKYHDLKVVAKKLDIGVATIYKMKKDNRI